MSDEQTFDVNWHEKSDTFTELERIGECAKEDAEWFLSTIRAYKDDPERLLKTASTFEGGLEMDRMDITKLIREMEAEGK